MKADVSDPEKNYLIAVHNIDSSFIFLSQNCYDILGYKPEELVGKSPYDIFHPLDRKYILLESHANVFKKKKILIKKYRIVSKLNRIVWLKSKIYVKHYNSDIPYFFVSLTKPSNILDTIDSFPEDIDVFNPYFDSLNLKIYKNLKNQKFELPITSLNSHLTFVHNVQTNSISFISGVKFFTGFNDDNFLLGVAYLDELIHQEDRKEVNIIISKVIKYFKIEPVPFKNQLSISYRIKTIQGNFVRVLRQMTQFEVDEKNTLVSCLNICTNINYLNMVNHVIYHLSGPGDNQHLFSNENGNKTFSKRELEILSYIYNGKSSNEISKCLKITKNTVDTHRRNMIKKIQVKNSVDLVKYALEQNLLKV